MIALASSSKLDPEALLLRPPTLPAPIESAVLPIDKPKGWTSFDVIRRLRRLTRIRKIGHAGTLDPMATGVLVCLIGRATKLMNHYLEGGKTYTGTIRLGQTTPSYDAETPVDQRMDASSITDQDLEEKLASFLGTIIQETPMYSAVKVDGERLYKKARRGEQVARPPRMVTIDAFTITGRDGDDVDFEVECSKGTYIRSLAHEYGQALGVGAHLVALRRTANGTLSDSDCWKIDDLAVQIELMGGGEV